MPLRNVRPLVALAALILSGALAGSVGPAAAQTTIHDVQGPGATSPMVGMSVTVRGIVTARTSTGCFIQVPDGLVDGDVGTSEGILVFTSSAPPAAAALGNDVQVTGTVVEFVPANDPSSPPLTEITSPTILVFSSGNPLPAATPLSLSQPDPTGSHDQLERFEGMRVTIPSLTVTGPTLGALNESSATATSNGLFYGTVTGLARPFRESGIQAPDSPPAGTGTIPPIPRWDQNPELIAVDSDGQSGTTALDLSAGTVITGLTGPLTYASRRYTLLRDPGTGAPSGGAATTVGTAPLVSEFTLAALSLQRFFDDVAGGAVVLSTPAFQQRLAKASKAIRDHLRSPDILAVTEVENLATLQAIAARVSSDAIAAGQPDPQYAAYLVEGNDATGIDVGFLTKVGSPGFPRVSVSAVTPLFAATTFLSPTSVPAILYEHPPLELVGSVKGSGVANFPLTVIVTHMFPIDSVASATPGSSGWTTVGQRARTQRHQQAVQLANYVQGLQAGDPTRRIAVVGDFQAYPFNDGYGDPLQVLRGAPVPDNQTATTGDGVDLVTPDLVNLIGTAPAAQRYQAASDGNARALLHVLANSALLAATTAYRLEFPRINADFPEVLRNDPNTATRVADTDPALAYFQPAASAAVGDPVPIAFGIQALTPNPARGPFTVSFALAGGAAARVELFDLAGRCVATRAIESPRSGVQALTLHADRPLASGVYHVRLTQGARRATARAVVMR